MKDTFSVKDTLSIEDILSVKDTSVGSQVFVVSNCCALLISKEGYPPDLYKGQNGWSLSVF